MSWADQTKKTLKEGKLATVRPRGNSMSPRIRSGQQVTLQPVDDPEELRKGVVVLCRVNGKDYLHFIRAIKPGPRYQIANIHGRINGWVGLNNIFGKVIKVEP